MQVRSVGAKIQIGGPLTRSQQAAVERVGISAADVIQNMEALSEEITETYGERREDMSSPSVSRPTRPPQPIQAPKSRLESKAEEIQQRIPDRVDDLDAMLDSAEQQIAEQKAEEATGPDLLAQVRSLLAKSKDAPTPSQLEAWKQSYGDIYCFALGPGDVYVFTYLKRAQWQRINEVMKEFQSKGGVAGDKLESQLKEKVVQNAVLYPKLTVEFFVNSRAGVVDGLFESIMFHSAFLAPQQVVNLTVQL